ncbi:phosphatidylinositol n-acetylglucosaminyltransferase subunit h [Nannochloropsis gaditana]|uniref:Phosphatidylinositol n-acetylglucosaminyltransferase subunit h n=1 Tax=Nannochloropsis gaditana TaxID=72520 RepID=W7TKC4_9STRA|nr:phosphatidylinositol n-acetylglucosaminyltransferase subunit h [Nannochloropsis gaditana]
MTRWRSPTPSSKRKKPELLYRGKKHAAICLHEFARRSSPGSTLFSKRAFVSRSLRPTAIVVLIAAFLGGNYADVKSFFLALSPWIYILGGFASVVFALTRLISSHIKQCNIETESMLLINDLGLQLQTRYTNGQEKSEFVDLGSVRGVVINEGITHQRIVYYLAFIVEGRESLLIAFQHLQPCLEDLLPVYQSARAFVGPVHEGASRSLFCTKL